MKKFLLIASILLSNLSIAQLSIGPRVQFNSESSGVGLGLQTGILVNRFRVGLDVQSFIWEPEDLTTETANNIKTTHNNYSDQAEFNGNIGYVFKSERGIFYPFIGAQYFRKKGKIEHNVTQQFYPYSKIYSVEEYYHDSNLGLNIGAGAQFNFGVLGLSLEAKYTIGDRNNISIGTGLLLNLGSGARKKNDSGQASYSRGNLF